MADHDASELARRLARLATHLLDMGAEHRRSALIDWASGNGTDRAAAERGYDLAVEEGLEPGMALALLCHGISVREFRSAATDVEAVEPAAPEWIDHPPEQTEAERERRLRETFRRLRSHLGREDDLQRAILAFGQEPDLEAYDY